MAGTLGDGSVMAGALCRREDCTVAQTGRCLLNNSPDECPERTAFSATATKEPTTVDVAPLEAPPSRPRFYPGLELGSQDASELMSQRYAHVIGILGAPDAGKTAMLVSIYLMLANSKLAGFTFADSDSLMAFDALSRGARAWNHGVMPEQMTGHTEGDDRGAGFLHLRVRCAEGKGTKHDLLLPDVPGEWTTQLIDRNSHARFSFLKRADAFWIVIDGRSLVNSASRNLAIHRTNLLLERIRQFETSATPVPAFLVLTRCDGYLDTPEAAIERIRIEAQRIGVPLQVAEVASFSDNARVTAGAGLKELLDRTLEPRPREPRSELLSGFRQMFRYRNWP